ncbi:GntR family transcriptional regulator [Pelagibius sp. CAU 1746]|uniref:GntR family transcriptional regulator n=1 Tax=Pelagibius sp. CAU 1746 TaxID=3140370 RepID=UPI00325C19E4
MSLHDETVAVLREMIVDRSLPPGQRIDEPSLCAELGISRTPLREAIKVLASEGLLKLMPSLGAVVTDITIEDVQAIFEMMEGLETQVGRLAAARATGAQIEELQDLHRRMLAMHCDGLRKDYFDLNQKIHLKLAIYTGNRFLAADYERYHGKIRRARYTANFSQSRWDESAKEHEEIMTALAQRDGERLSELLRDHLHETSTIVIQAIREEYRIAKGADAADAS